MLTKKQIQKLIELTQQKTVAEFDGYKVVRHEGGYSDDKEIGAIQAALSIMLMSKPWTDEEIRTEAEIIYADHIYRTGDDEETNLRIVAEIERSLRQCRNDALAHLIEKLNEAKEICYARSEEFAEFAKTGDELHVHGNLCAEQACSGDGHRIRDLVEKMSNHDNHRRDEEKRTEHGPRWEKSNPSGQRGVARGRKRWKDLNTRRERRTGKTGGWSPNHRRKPMKRDELEAMSQEDLDEMVHEAKAEEAAEINNKGKEAQIQYLYYDRMEVTVIDTDGNRKQVPFPTTLDGWQALVGGMIEPVHMTVNGEQAMLIVNEEGLLKEMQLNIEASKIAGHPIVGPAVLLTGDAYIRFTCEC